MTKQRTIRVGVVGVGGIAQSQHIPGYLRCQDVEIAALCDVNQALLESMGQKYAVSTLTTDYRELVELDHLDAVDICTANDMHHPVAMAAIAQGKHVFCEKPLALNYEQARQMVEAAQAADVVTGVGFVHRVTPAARLAHQLIAEGALGDIYHVIATFASGDANYAEQPMSWRRSRAKAGSGALFDLGAHMIDMMCWWLGQEITAVCAHTRTFVTQRQWPENHERAGEPALVDAEDASTLMADFAGGAMGTFVNSYVFTGRGFAQRSEVYGSQGALIYDQATPCALRVCLGAEMLTLSAAWGVGRRKEEPFPIIPVAEALKDRWTPDETPARTLNPDFIAAIRGEEAFLPTFYEGMKVQEVLDAALLSAEQARWVKLPLP